jgi:hypothetical protein
MQWRLVSEHTLRFGAIVSRAIPAEVTAQDSLGDGHPQHTHIRFNFHKQQLQARVGTSPA